MELSSIQLFVKYLSLQKTDHLIIQTSFLRNWDPMKASQGHMEGKSQSWMLKSDFFLICSSDQLTRLVPWTEILSLPSVEIYSIWI